MNAQDARKEKNTATKLGFTEGVVVRIWVQIDVLVMYFGAKNVNPKNMKSFQVFGWEWNPLKIGFYICCSIFDLDRFKYMSLCLKLGNKNHKILQFLADDL